MVKKIESYLVYFKYTQNGEQGVGHMPIHISDRVDYPVLHMVRIISNQINAKEGDIIICNIMPLKGLLTPLKHD